MVGSDAAVEIKRLYVLRGQLKWSVRCGARTILHSVTASTD
jgi:hypothetical protein